VSDTSRSVAIRPERARDQPVQGIGGIYGKALALSILGGAVYGVIKLIDLVTRRPVRSCNDVAKRM